uniref:RING-type domain-containing protein n=1 Tax=Tetranychus urticae TaxID=32264 RepID=A0A158P526_TETUR
MKVNPSIENWTDPEAIESLKKFLRMKLIDHRFNSFDGSPYTLEQKCTAAYDGFYLSSNKRNFVCFSCGIHIPTTLANFKITNLHKTFSPDCAYCKREELGLKLWQDGNSGFSYFCVPKKMEFGYQENLIKMVKLVKKSFNTIEKSLTSSSYILNPMKVYQLFQIRENRYYSFKNSTCPIEKVNAFVESGFYYLGYQNIVQCAFCSLAFRGNNPRHPSVIHRFFYPGCPFLTLERYRIDREYCIICLVEPRRILYLPCKHLITCEGCDDRLLDQNQDDCPLCRTAIIIRLTCISP